MVINWLNAQSGSTPAGEGEAESADSFFEELGTDSSSDDSLGALLAIDDYHFNRRK